MLLKIAFISFRNYYDDYLYDDHYGYSNPYTIFSNEEFDCLNQSISRKTIIGFNKSNQVFNTKAFKVILKKCPNIRCISILNTKNDFIENNRILELIVKYCRELTEIYLDFDLITSDNFNSFMAKFGQTIRKCDYYSNYYIEFILNPIILDNCTFIEQLNLLSLYSNPSLYNSQYFKLDQLPRLKCLVFWLTHKLKTHFFYTLNSGYTSKTCSKNMGLKPTYCT